MEAFCGGLIGFMDIERVVDYTLQEHSPVEASTLEEIVEADRAVRVLANSRIERIARER